MIAPVESPVPLVVLTPVVGETDQVITPPSPPVAVVLTELPGVIETDVPQYWLSSQIINCINQKRFCSYK